MPSVLKNNKFFVFSVLCFFCIGSDLAIQYTIDAPSEVEVGEWFTVNITASSETEQNMTIYSYIFKELNCIGQGWTVNQQKIQLTEETQTIVLKDLVKFNTEQGIYKLRVKMNFEAYSINETFMVQVNSSQVFEESYLYLVLILVSITGISLIAWRWTR